MASKNQTLLRSLPSVTSLLNHEEVLDWLHGLPRATVVSALQDTLDAARQEILSGERDDAPEVEEILQQAEERIVERETPSLRKVINATGIVLHTGLGRAPLSDAAIDAIVEGASGYANLEYDLKTGRRGDRTSHVADQLTELTAAEGATVVNNNAAATLMILQTLASGKEVVVSRGQLVEIGGSFRLPDIMQASGATLKEVGTTNRTRPDDYERAISDRTAMIMRVHTSNYRIVGFTEDVAMSELVDIAHRNKLVAVDDLGSGTVVDPVALGFDGEPWPARSIKNGADLVCFSGDKLLGGPQCGIIVGRKDLIAQIESNPLMRTYRVDKLTLLALEATLSVCADPREAIRTIPTLAMLSASTEELASRAQKLCDQLSAALPEEKFFVGSSVGYVGGGALPQHELESIVVQWRPSSGGAEPAAAMLRDGDIPVVATIRDDALCFDVRTIRDDDFEPLVAAVTSAAWNDPDDPPTQCGL